MITVFGTYPQSASGERAPIEWFVLDRRGGASLVVSKRGLDCRPFHDRLEDVSWNTCALRAWLNDADDGFLGAAFSESERDSIVLTSVAAEGNPDFGTDPGEPTRDKVFLLSAQEVERYFDDSEDRACEPTEYAIKQGAWMLDKFADCQGRNPCDWLLRSPGLEPCYACYIDFDCDLLPSAFVHERAFAIRPAMWIRTADEA